MLALAVCAVAGWNSSETLAASGTWLGTTDNTWAGPNWTVTPAPGTGDTATFNGVGNGNTTIDLGIGIAIGNILFDTPNAAAYNIGAGVIGSQSLTLNNGGAITVNSTVTNNETFDAGLFLGTDATAQSYYITNNSLSNTFSFDGNVTGGPAGGTAGTKTLTVNGSGNTVIGGSLTLGNASNIALTKNGSGTLTFNGTTNASLLGSGTTGGACGRMTVNAGKLVLDFSNFNAAGNANLLNSFTPVTLGGGTLQIIGNATNASTQSFTNGTGISLAAGQSTISAAPSAGGSIPTLSLGATTPALGSAVMYVGPATATYSGGNSETQNNVAATGTITTTTAGQSAFGAGGLLMNVAAAVNGNLGAYATVGAYDWASTNTTADAAGTSPYTIIGASQVSGFYTTNGNLGGSTAYSNVDVVAAGFTISSASSAYGQTLRFNTPSSTANTPTTITAGANVEMEGILVTPNMGAQNAVISGGTWHPYYGTTNSATPNALQIWQNNTLGFFNFAAVIGNGKEAKQVNSIVQNGPGTVVYSGVNTYVGATYLNGGVSVVTADSGFGAVATGAAINLNGGTIFANATFTLDNAGANKRTINLLSNGGGLAAAAGSSLTIDGSINGGTLTIGIPASAANDNVAGLLPGTGSIAGGQAVDTANTTAVMGTGTVYLRASGFQTGDAVTGGATLNIDSQYELGGGNYTGMTFNNGILQYATTLQAGTGGAYQDITSNAGVAAQTVTLAGNATIDTNSHAITYANTFGNGGAGKLIVSDSAGTGTLTLAAGNNYSGGTLVTAGTLNVTNTTGSATGIGPVAITGGKLSGSGIIAGAVNLSGGSIAPGAAGTTLNLNSITFYSGSFGFSLNGASNTSSLILTNAATFNATPTLSFSGTGIAAGQTYTVLTSATNISGGSYLSSIYPATIGRTVVTATESPNQKSIVLTVIGSGGAAHLIWAGGVSGLSTTVAPQGDGSTWNDTQSSGASNWNNGGKYDYFYDADSVTFNDTGSPTHTVNLTTSVLPGSVTVNTASAYTFQGSGLIGGTTGLQLVSGTLNLNTPSNTYSGGTNISAGAVLATGAAGALPGTGTVTVAGTLNLNGNSQTIGVLNDGGVSTGMITSDGGTSTLTLATAGSSTFSGIVQNGSGNLGLTIAGTGTQLLTGSNTYSGTTTINSGTILQIGNNTAAMALPPGSAVTDNGSLVFNLSGGTYAAGNTISGSGKLIQSGAAGNILQLNSNTYSGGTTVTSGTIQLTGAAGTGTGDVAIASGADLDLNGQSPSVGGLSGAGAIDSSTAGTMNFSIGNTNNAGTFSGSIKNTSGMLNLTQYGTGTQTFSGTVGTSASPVGVIADSIGGLMINGGTVYAASLLEPNNASVTTVTGNATVFLSGDLGADDSNGANSGSIQLLSGTITTNTATVGRDQVAVNNGFPVPATTDGIYVNGATLNITNTLSIGRLSSGSLVNSETSLRLDSGSVTVGGTTVISNDSNQRSATLAINGGTFTSNDTTGTGIQLGGTTNTYTPYAELLITGGTLNTNMITLGGSAQTAGTDQIFASGGTIYLGSGGIALGGATNTATYVSFGSTTTANAPVIAANANWSTGAAITLANSSTGYPVTIKAADASGVGHNITLAGALSGTGGLLKIGSGYLALAGGTSYTGPTTVSAGTLVDTNNTVLSSSSSLNISSSMVIQNSPSLQNITQQVAGGFNNGAWNGSSSSAGIPIASSMAASDGTHLRALGVIQNDNGLGGQLYSSFEGYNTLNESDVLIKLTYYGDADLNGKVDGSDYSRIDSAYVYNQTASSPLTGWFNGDFNYDGVINGSDYTLIDNAFNTQGATIASEIAAPNAQATAQLNVTSGSAVPEPATLGLIVIGAAGLLGRRHRGR